MKRYISGPLPDHARNILQRLGYGEKRTRQGQISFTRRLGGAMFPHFHIYAEERDGGLQINLHLDQKEHGAGNTIHSGEYEGRLVEEEMRAIVAAIQTMNTRPATPPNHHDRDDRDDEKPRGGFWKGLFGG